MALVEAYRTRGYRVVATARSITQPDDPNIVAVAGDIGERKTAERTVSEAIARFGRIDTLVNNAGIFIAKSFTQYTEADLVAILSVNVTGFFHITQLSIAEMEKRRSGHVVQITTSLVDHANLCCALGARLADEGWPKCSNTVACNRVCAARHSCERGRAWRDPNADASVETHEALNALHPLGRMGEIADIVEAVLYLEAAPFVTGEILHVDGGQSAGH